MVRWQRFVLLIIGGSGLGLTGCSGRAAVPGRNVGSLAPASGGTQRGAGKAAPREAVFSVFNEPEYGISFRYPRNYALEEGELEEPIPGARSQAELTEEQPEAMLLATVAIPEDAYPNTSFIEGSLQFAVDPSLMPGSCKEILNESDRGARLGTGSIKIQGVLFTWAEDTTEEAGTESVERRYAGYANGTCYEFFVHVAVGETGGNDGLEKQADAKKIVRHLEKIVSSLQWEAKRAVAGGEKVPE
jgi:hypothetical protein